METQSSKTPPLKFRLDVLLAAMPIQQRGPLLKQLNFHGINADLRLRMRRAQQGDTYSPPADKLKIIADLLNVTMEDLFTENATSHAGNQA